MITEQDKNVLADLIQRESPSDILQALLMLAGKESTRLQDLIGGRTLLEQAPSIMRYQCVEALAAAEARVAVLRSAVQEATGKEIQLGMPHVSAMATGAVQMALL